MILYLGSSNLVRLYVEEPASDRIMDWVKSAEIVATCRIAHMEIMSALDTRFRKGDLPKEDYALLAEKFSEDWKEMAKVDFDEYEAGNLVMKYGLTRFGALHLSAAKLIASEYEKRKLETRGKFEVTLFFSSVDEKLIDAAAAEGLKVLYVN
jgi:uncharacterized protein